MKLFKKSLIIMITTTIISMAGYVSAADETPTEGNEVTASEIEKSEDKVALKAEKAKKKKKAKKGKKKHSKKCRRSSGSRLGKRKC